MESRVLVSSSAAVFLAVILFGLYIFVKYLVIRSQRKRMAMMLFYLVTLGDLILRMAIMISLNWRAYFAAENLVLSLFSLWSSLMVGTSHMQNLSSLTVDLQTLKCSSLADHQKIVKRQRYSAGALILWTVLLCGALVCFFTIDLSYGRIMLANASLFTVQACFMLIINARLHRAINKTFNAEELRSERNFLKCTLVLFTLSYILVVLRSFAIYTLIDVEGNGVEKWVCDNNFRVNSVNVLSWLVIDLLPIGTIFCLHWKNF